MSGEGDKGCQCQCRANVSTIDATKPHETRCLITRHSPLIQRPDYVMQADLRTELQTERPGEVLLASLTEHIDHSPKGFHTHPWLLVPNLLSP